MDIKVATRLCAQVRVVFVLNHGGGGTSILLSGCHLNRINYHARTGSEGERAFTFDIHCEQIE